jgi:two-component system response regulator AtoC/two-component system response regulator HupR/HoxA
VRELEHVVARGFLLADGETIDTLQLPVQAGAAPAGTGQPAGPAADGAPAAVPPAAPTNAWPTIPLAEAERRTILAAMQACNGEKAAAARLLGISRTALYEKLRRYGADAQ